MWFINLFLLAYASFLSAQQQNSNNRPSLSHNSSSPIFLLSFHLFSPSRLRNRNKTTTTVAASLNINHSCSTPSLPSIHCCNRSHAASPSSALCQNRAQQTTKVLPTFPRSRINNHELQQPSPMLLFPAAAPRRLPFLGDGKQQHSPPVAVLSRQTQETSNNTAATADRSRKQLRPFLSSAEQQSLPRKEAGSSRCRDGKPPRIAAPSSSPSPSLDRHLLRRLTQQEQQLLRLSF